jgi:hypothetical protein
MDTAMSAGLVLGGIFTYSDAQEHGIDFMGGTPDALALLSPAVSDAFCAGIVEMLKDARGGSQ